MDRAIPKYIRLADHLREQIRSGALAPSDRVPSFPQLRGEWGISQNTVEKAHALLEEEGLIVRQQGKGTFVSRLQRRPSNRVIGTSFHVSGRHLAYNTALIAGMQKGAEAAGYEILLLNGASPSVRWEKIDAVICAKPPELVTPHLPPGMRCVSLMYCGEGLSSVVADDYQGMYDATKFLLEYGHRRIAYLHEENPLTPSRLRGYRDALVSSGIAAEKGWERLLIPYSEPGFLGRGRQSMREWLSDGWKELGCTALICQNDHTASGVLEVMREAGIRVPGDVSVMGFDSTDECELTHPRLSSVHLPLEAIAQRGVELLLEELDTDEVTPRVITLPARIDLRDSVARI